MADAANHSSRPVSAPDGKGRRTEKYRRRQAEIVKAAVTLINRKGIRAMTLADVAAGLGIVPTGVIYYFASKEDLAATCFLKAIEAYQDLLALAEAAEGPAGRLKQFIKGYVSLAREINLGERDPLVFFNDVRALNDAAVNAAYTAMFRRTRDLLIDASASTHGRQEANAVAHLVLSQLFWLVAWLYEYDLADYDRAAERLFDILYEGLCADAAQWPPPRGPNVIRDPAADVSQETFLRAATQLINEEGYRGASVDKISARLNVTKGAFYHYNDAKDDLVEACFRRSVDVMRRAQRALGQSVKASWDRLSSAVVWLVEHELAGDTPLLRTSALTSAPESIQTAVLAELGRISLTFESMIADGVIDGSVRPVDPRIAAHAVTAMINAASELRYWSPKLTPEEATTTYARAFLLGIGRTVVGA
jgi:AcrR family transcriptional regulator